MPLLNFSDVPFRIDILLQQAKQWARAATEQINNQLDTKERSSTGENSWHGDQPIDEEGYNETTQRCANFHLSESEYGRVLFERDLARRNLRIANYRPDDKLRQQRKREDGMATIRS